MTSYETFTVPVEGGDLHAARWGSGSPVVLCSHGVTANHTEFHALADQLDECTVVAVDHRGRARSREIGGPWGLDHHAADLTAVLDHLGIDQADVVLGHSMGGFVAAVFGATFPERAGGLLLVDGGIPLMDEIPEGLTIEQLIQAIIGPAMERLDMTFESFEAYHRFWEEHPALGSDWSAYVEEYVDYDLVGEPPELRPSTRKEAVIGDTESMLVGDLLPRSLESLAGPVRFLRAERGMFDADPLYAEERIQTWGPKVNGFSDRTIDDVNHYTIMISERGAKAVADEVRALLDA